jgi:hypothetical protein
MFKSIHRQSFNFSVDVTNTTKILPPNTELFRAGDVLNVEDLTQYPFGWFALNVIDTIPYSLYRDPRYMTDDNYIFFKKYPTIVSYKTTEPLKILIITPELVKQDSEFLENSVENGKRNNNYEKDMEDIIKIQNKYKDLDGVAYIGFLNRFDETWHDEICLFNSNTSIIKLYKSYVWNPLQIKEKNMKDVNKCVDSLSEQELNNYTRLYSILNIRNYEITTSEDFNIFVYIVKTLNLFDKLREETLHILKQDINGEMPDEPVIKMQVIKEMNDFIRKLSTIQIKDFKKIIEKYFK